MGVCERCTPLAGCATRPDGRTPNRELPAIIALPVNLTSHSHAPCPGPHLEGSGRSFSPIAPLGMALRAGELPPTSAASSGKMGCARPIPLPPFFDFASTSHRAWIAHEVATFPISRGSSRARLWFPRSPRGQSQAGPAEVTPRGGRHDGSTNVFCLSPPGAGEAGRRDNWALLEISVSPRRCLSRALSLHDAPGQDSCAPSSVLGRLFPTQYHGVLLAACTRNQAVGTCHC